MDRRLIFTLTAVALLAVGGAALAQTPATQDAETTEQAQEGYVAVPFAGMQVFIDQETGRMRPPTAREAQQLANAMKKRFAHYRPASVFQHKNGNQSAVVGTDYLRFSVLQLDADGNATASCVKGPEQAQEVLEAHVHDHRATE